MTVTALPKFLVGALAVLIRDELHLSETQLGTAVSLVVTVAAITSVHGGRIVQRISAHRAIPLIAIVSGTAMLGIATLTTTYGHLLGWLALVGGANALTHPTSAMAIAGDVPPGRQGLAFGINTSAPPAASMLAGITVPTIGLTVGWRWAYVAAAVCALAIIAVAPRRGADRDVAPIRETDAGTRTAVLLVLTVGMGFATAAAGALGAFHVTSAVHNGAAVGTAGLWFAIGGLSSIGARICCGWLADRRQARHLAVAGALMATGSLGFALLAHAREPSLMVLATILAFAAGWGWPGLFQLTITRLNPDTPAAATGIAQTGAFIGAAIGPLAFGALVEHGSYALAWQAGAGALIVAAVLMQVGRRMMLARPAAVTADPT
jgi:MFS family permease